jgi:Flp pilus assembly protein TadD
MKCSVQIACLMVLIVLALVRNSIWKDDNMLWSDTIKKSPFRTRAYNELAVSAIRAGEYKTAIDTLNTALRLGLYLPQAYTNIGAAYEGLNQLDMAILAYRKAISAFPNNPIPYFNLGVAYYKKHERDRALEYFLRARDLNPYEPDVHQNLGIIYREKGNTAQALEEFRLYEMLK